MKLDLMSQKIVSVYGGQDIVLRYHVTDGKEEYEVEGKIRGTHDGWIEFSATAVVANLTNTEDTLIDDVILDRVNEITER